MCRPIVCEVFVATGDSWATVRTVRSQFPRGAAFEPDSGIVALDLPNAICCSRLRIAGGQSCFVLIWCGEQVRRGPAALPGPATGASRRGGIAHLS